MDPRHLEYRRDETDYWFKETVPSDRASRGYMSTIDKRVCKEGKSMGVV
jgi:hypothetical protein